MTLETCVKNLNVSFGKKKSFTKSHLLDFKKKIILLFKIVPQNARDYFNNTAHILVCKPEGFLSLVFVLFTY